jgi:hypothetical protein
MKVVDLEEHADESFARRETVVYQKAITGSHDAFKIRTGPGTKRLPAGFFEFCILRSDVFAVETGGSPVHGP